MGENRKSDKWRRIGVGVSVPATIIGSSLVARKIAPNVTYPLSEEEAGKIIKEVAGREVPIRKVFDKARVSYVPYADVINLEETSHPAFVAHEAGHAKGFNTLLGSLRYGGRMLGLGGVLSAPIIALTGKPEDKRGRTGAIVGGIGTGLMSAEELLASIRGYKGLKRLGYSPKVLRESKKILGRALGTYGTVGLSTGVLLPLLIQKLRSPGKNKQASLRTWYHQKMIESLNRAIEREKKRKEHELRSALIGSTLVGSIPAIGIPITSYITARKMERPFGRKAWALSAAAGLLPALGAGLGTFYWAKSHNPEADIDLMKLEKARHEAKLGKKPKKVALKSSIPDILAQRRSIAISTPVSLAVNPYIGPGLAVALGGPLVEIAEGRTKKIIERYGKPKEAFFNSFLNELEKIAQDYAEELEGPGYEEVEYPVEQMGRIYKGAPPPPPPTNLGSEKLKQVGSVAKKVGLTGLKVMDSLVKSTQQPIRVHSMLPGSLVEE
uniref:Uncharacterized protein n=1 Tax=Dictyoglomus turgidum TaxID=513050 RepID=A0A7C3WVP0_9BACT